MKSPGLPLSLKVKETHLHIHEQAQDFFLCACAALSMCTHARPCTSVCWDRWLLIVFSWAVEGSASSYWLDGGMGEERERVDRKTERVQKRKRDSVADEKEMWQDRVATWNIESLSTEWMGEVWVCVHGGGRDRCHVCIPKCLHPCVCVCAGGWGYVTGCLIWMLHTDAAPHSLCIIEWSLTGGSPWFLQQVHVAGCSLVILSGSLQSILKCLVVMSHLSQVFVFS